MIAKRKTLALLTSQSCEGAELSSIPSKFHFQFVFTRKGMIQSQTSGNFKTSYQTKRKDAR
jgi:hypothetical protein